MMKENEVSLSTYFPDDIPHSNIFHLFPFHNLLDPLQSRCEPPHVPNENDYSILHPRFFDLISFRECLSHRFLDEDVFAGVGSLDGLGCVVLICCEDEDEVDGC